MAARRALQLMRVGVGSAALVSIPALTYPMAVHAASKDPCDPCRRVVKITELPIYGEPEETSQYCFVPQESTPMEQAIGNVREAIWEFLHYFEDTSEKVKEKYEIGKAHTQGLIDFLQNDPGMVPRVTVITIAGLGGIVAGYRGGVMRKLFYSTAAITAATSLCYPKEAVNVSTRAYNYTVQSVKRLWSDQDNTEQAVAVPAPIEAADLKKAEQSKPSPPAKTPEVSQPKPAFTAVKGDFGQSKPEDKDMYTTRSK